jgi:Type VI secretion, TssG/Histidine kinase-, DNA gyrase B-, and HSP90-like ATPase
VSYKFQVHLRGIIELLSKHLYSGPHVYLRELLQNGVDAIRARIGAQPEHEGEITLEVLGHGRKGQPTLLFTDNGIGLTEAEIHEFLATIGQSSKRGEDWNEPTDFIGRFGVGLLSCFIVCDEIVVLTRSARPLTLPSPPQGGEGGVRGETDESGDEGAALPAAREVELTRLDDLALLRFSGLFAHRPRCAVSLEAFLQVYLKLPVKVLQFQGQWLHLNTDSQTSTGVSNNRLGQDTLVGDRVWDVQSKVRIRLGPLTYAEFQELLPDRTNQPSRKRIFLLAQLVQYYLGAEFDVEFQLVLTKDEVPAARTGPQSRLGWNTWARTQPYPRAADDTVFVMSDQQCVNAPRAV